MVEWTCATFVSNELQSIEKIANENCKYLFPLDDLPHMEPRLRQIFYETYLMTLFGFSNISIILQGVLLEALIKEIIFSKEQKEYNRAFGSAINYSIKRNFITKYEYEFFNTFKMQIRNLYQHIDVEEITKGSTAKVYKIPLKKGAIAESIKKGVEEVMKGDSESPTKMSSQELRPLGDILKLKIDEERYFDLFLVVDTFVRHLCKKYFPM